MQWFKKFAALARIYHNDHSTHVNLLAWPHDVERQQWKRKLGKDTFTVVAMDLELQRPQAVHSAREDSQDRAARCQTPAIHSTLCQQKARLLGLTLLLETDLLPWENAALCFLLDSENRKVEVCVLLFILQRIVRNADLSQRAQKSVKILGRGNKAIVPAVLHLGRDTACLEFK